MFLQLMENSQKVIKWIEARVLPSKFVCFSIDRWLNYQLDSNILRKLDAIHFLRLPHIRFIFI